MNKKYVIMDVDTGIDDALALILCHSFENLELIGVSTVLGNTSVDNAYRNTCYVLDQLELDVPVSKGSHLPLAQAKIHEGTAHGKGGLGNVAEVTHRERPQINLFDFYEDLIMKCEEKVSIIATGPLTNIAKVLLAMPQLKERIECISIMGGAILMGNRTASTEFNIIADPEAAQIVFTSGVPLILAPLDVTYQAYLTLEETQAIRKTLNPNYEHLVQMLEFYIDGYKTRTYLPGAPLHDSVAVAAIAHPELFKSLQAYAEVDCTESYTRGTTIVDGYNTLKRTPNITVLESVDREAFIALTQASYTKFR